MKSAVSINYGGDKKNPTFSSEKKENYVNED